MASRAQSPDTVIRNSLYTSYFSYQMHEPLYVTSNLYHAGGHFPRKGMVFKTGGLPYSATASDYAHNGYDEGHMADAADFAYDSSSEESTFRFYNCVPQTARLNRGTWKTLETLVRKESQTDSLFVVCGSIFGTKKIGKDSIAVPDYCWKIVYSLTTHKVLYCWLFPNDNSDSYKDIDISQIPYKLPTE